MDRPTLDLARPALQDAARLELLAAAGLREPGREASLDRWAAVTARALRAPLALVSFIDDRRQVVKGAFAPDRPIPAEIALADSLCTHVVAGRATIAIDDTRELATLAGHPAVRAGIVAYAGAPILADGHAVGSLCVTDAQPRSWDPEDLEALAELAAAIGGDVLLRTATAELERSNAFVASQNRIHELMAEGAPLEDVLAELVRSIERYDPSLSGSILLLDRELQTLHTGAAPSLPRAYTAAMEGMVIGPENGSCGRAAALGREVITPDVREDPRWAGSRAAKAVAHGLVHCWSFPIRDADGQVLGTLAFYGGRPRLPGDATRDLLRDAARLAGIAIGRHAADEQLLHQATHDGLTGLPNRRLVFDRLAGALARSRRSGAPVTLLFVDLDRLKLINDTLGHDVGDDVLVRLAERLAGAVRPGDTVARVGGDEFLVVAEDVDAIGAESLARRLMAALAAPVSEGGLSVTASIGAAVVAGDADPREAVRRADAAMYAAKERGGAAFETFRRATPLTAVRRLEVESALRGALERGELRLWAQPVHDMARGVTSGQEILLRWQHPELGDVGPAEFIPIAEETGLIADIGTWVLREAIERIARAGEAAPWFLSVNVSAHQVRRDDLAEIVRDALEASGLPARRLVLEVTETALLGSDGVTTRTLREVRELGVRVALDDFGTGYSSLALLRRHEIDTIKIDRSFISGLPGDDNDRAIVAAIAGMAAGLDRIVIAEGVETEEQLACVRELGCRFAQGYLLGRPAPLLP